MVEPNLYSHSGQNWLPFALLELTSTADAWEKMESWLKDALQPLELTGDFTGKVLASARDSVARIPAEIRHIRLLLHTSIAQPLPGQTWGFFRVERNEGSPDEGRGTLHTIIFYLYLEGLATPG